MPIELYYWDFSPPCRAVLATAHTLGIVLTVKTIDYHSGQLKSNEFLQLNPNHTVPTLVDSGLPMWESGAIMTYLVNKFKPNSSLYPKKVFDRALVDQIIHFSTGCLMNAFRSCMFHVYVLQQSPPEESLATLKEKISVVERLLGDQTYITGDTLTLADISVGAIIPSLDMIQAGLTPSTLLEYLDRVYKACPHLMQINNQACAK